MGPGKSSREPLVNTLKILYGKKRLKRLMVAFAAVFSGIQLLVPFQILAVKNGYGFGDRTSRDFRGAADAGYGGRKLAGVADD